MKQLLFLIIALLLIGNKAVNAQVNADSKMNGELKRSIHLLL